MPQRLMLLDTASLYFRAFYGVPDTVRAPDGTPVNAVRGLLDMIARLVTDFEPTALAACWDDAWRPRWRVDLIPSYKLHRVAEFVTDPGTGDASGGSSSTTRDRGVDIEETPPGLVQQIPTIRAVLEAFGIAIVGAPDHEADDVIGTLATRSAAAGVPVDVVTGDRDLFQLADDERGVRIIYTARGMSKLELVTDAVVQAKYGIPAARYVDFAVLRGDTSDGLPGVAGVGEKTAATLVREYGDVAAMVSAAADEGMRATVRARSADATDARPHAQTPARPEAPPLSASLRSKIAAAADYLAVAPRVVEVVRDLALDGFDAEADAGIHPLTDEQRASIATLSERWNLGGSADRATKALSARATAGD